MLIATTILRPGGSRHEIDGVIYHFEKVDDPTIEVCDVADPRHIIRFLEIPGFHSLQGEPAPDLEEPAPERHGMDPDALSELSRDDIAKLYKEFFGKAPHWKLGVEIMRARLIAGSED